MPSPNKLSLHELYSVKCPDCGSISPLSIGRGVGGEVLSISDTENSGLQKAFNKMARWIFKDKKGNIQPEDLNNNSVHTLINEINTVLQKSLIGEIAQTPVGSVMKTALSDNLFIFSGLKTYHEMKEVGTLLMDGENVKPFSKFWQDVQSVHQNYNRNYLEAEYIFATQSAQMAYKWSEFEADGDRYNLQYRTAQDDRVRAEHATLENTTLPPSDLFWNSYYPPNGWRCRCTAVQVRKDKYQTSNSAQAIQFGEKATAGKNQDIFRFNPGKEKRIFPDKHPYYPQGGCNDKLAIGDDEKCKAYQIIKKSATAIERERYLNEMKPLFSKKINKQVEIDGVKKEISIGFNSRGNKHLYSDTLTRVKGKFNKEELSIIDKKLDDADFVKYSKLSKTRKDEITGFYYFKDKFNDLYYNVAVSTAKLKGGKEAKHKFLYSITKNIK